VSTTAAALGAPGMRPAVYRGQVMHKRFRPFVHRFTYRVFSLLLDLDALPAFAARSRLFRHNRFGLLSFHDKDHGPRDGSALRPWIEAAARRNGVELAGGRIFVLCFPRILGYVFNPLTIYYCHDAGGALCAVLYEVKNTFGDQHGYFLPLRGSNSAAIEQGCEKIFHVSPFMALEGRYAFRLKPPGERLSVLINYQDQGGTMLHASLNGTRRELSDRQLLAAWARHPLMTLKVIAAIHWEGLRLWRKGAPFFRRTPPPHKDVTP
jgi:DUF1365 family protein